jgi:hypothetical protein
MLLMLYTRLLRSKLRNPSKLPNKIINRSIKSSNLTIEYVDNHSNYDRRPNKEDLVFGTTTTDHMLMIEWNKNDKWGPPKILPYQNLQISPAASCLHYGKLRRLVSSQYFSWSHHLLCIIHQCLSFFENNIQ